MEPKFYSKHSDIQKVDNTFVIKKYLKSIRWTKQGARILDVGCGDGFTTLELLLPRVPKNFGKIVGADLSEKMVQFANQMCKRNNITFVPQDIAGDCRNNPDLLEEFDHVFSFYCLHWVQNQKKAFENIYKMLRPGGDMLLSFLGHHPLYNIYENMSKKIQWAPYLTEGFVSPYHYSKHPEDDVSNLLRQAGFAPHTCTIERRQFVFESWDQVTKALIAVDPTIKQLQPDDQSKYIADFIDEARKVLSDKLTASDNNNNNNNNGVRIPIEYQLIVVYARKQEKETP